jgi:hypothetical protein
MRAGKLVLISDHRPAAAGEAATATSKPHGLGNGSRPGRASCRGTRLKRAEVDRSRAVPFADALQRPTQSAPAAAPSLPVTPGRDTSAAGRTQPRVRNEINQHYVPMPCSCTLPKAQRSSCMDCRSVCGTHGAAVRRPITRWPGLANPPVDATT